MRARFSAAVPTLLALAACGGADRPGWGGVVDTLAHGTVVVENPAEGFWGPDETWSLEEELRIGSAMSEGPDLFASVAGIAVDAAGRIHVLDRQARELRTFDAAGRHVRTVGREGGGPGEFADPIGVTVGPQGGIWVTDPNNARYAVFSAEGEYRTSHTRPVGGYSVPWNGGFGQGGRFHEKVSSGGGPAVIRMDGAFQPVDTARFPEFEEPRFVLIMDAGRMSTSVPFATSQVERWDPRGYLWTAVTGDYTLTQTSFAGDTLRVIHGPPVESIPVTPKDREEVLEGLEWFTNQGGRVDPSRMPSEKPPISTFHLADDGHLWVRLTARDDEEGYHYHVFDPEGRFLGPVATDTGLGNNPVFREDRIYGVVSDSLGVQYVVRAALDRG